MGGEWGDLEVWGTASPSGPQLDGAPPQASTGLAQPPPSGPRPWGKGRPGGSPPDGEMWPFTFTLQCQPLNHCLRARAQGCSPPAANKATATATAAGLGPASSAHPGDPARCSQGPALHPPPSSSLPSPLTFCSFFVCLFVPKTHLREQAAQGQIYREPAFRCPSWEEVLRSMAGVRKAPIPPLQTWVPLPSYVRGVHCTCIFLIQ